MLDYISFQCCDFYDATLSILGIERCMTFETSEHKIAGYGVDGKSFFWIAEELNP